MNCLQCKNIFEEENNNEILKERIAKQNEEKKLKELHHNIPLIHFMCAKPDNKNWCGATFP